MPIAIKCASCGKQYQVKDHLAGQTVSCAACRKPISIPAAARPAAAVPVAAGARAPQAAAAEYARYGLEGPIARTPDLFAGSIAANAPDPLANHVVIDPGFGSSEYVAPKKKELNLSYSRLDEEDSTAADNSAGALMGLGILATLYGLVAVIFGLTGVEYPVVPLMETDQQWKGGLVALLLGGAAAVYGYILSRRLRKKKK